MRRSEEGRLSFRAIEVFVAAVEEGSIQKAALRLGASASAISTQLSNLEEVLDARLIERSAHRFQLTAAGELFAPRAKSILDEVTNSKIELASARHAPKMDIRIAAIEDFDLEILPDLIARLQSDYPQSQFRVNSGASHESHASLSRRSVDMIIAADNTTDIDWIDEYEVLHDPYIIVTANKDLVNAPIDKLTNHPLLRYSQEQLIGQQIEAQLRRTKITIPRKFECSTNLATFAMVQKFDGWAITTATAFLGASRNGNKDTSKLFASPLPFAGFSRTISVYSRRDTMGEIPYRFAAHLKDSLNELLIKRIPDELPFMKGKLYTI